MKQSICPKRNRILYPPFLQLFDNQPKTKFLTTLPRSPLAAPEPPNPESQNTETADQEQKPPI